MKGFKDKNTGENMSNTNHLSYSLNSDHLLLRKETMFSE